MLPLALVTLYLYVGLDAPQVDHPIVGQWKTGDDFEARPFGDEVGWELRFYVNGRFDLLSDGGMRIQTSRTGKFELNEDLLFLECFRNGDGLNFEWKLESDHSRLLLRDVENVWSVSLERTNEPNVSLRGLPKMPESLEEAVGLLISEMSQDETHYMATRMEEDLISFHMGWGMGIRNRFGLWSGNKKLLASCGSIWMHPDSASGVIIEAVWKRLRGDLDPDYLAEIEKVHAVMRETKLEGSALKEISIEALVELLNAAIDKTYPNVDDKVKVVAENDEEMPNSEIPIRLGFDDDEECTLEMILSRMKFQIFTDVHYEPGIIKIVP